MFERYVNRPTRGDADLFETVIWNKFNQDRSTLDLYTSAGQKLSAAISSTVSVDDALYQLGEFPEGVQLGKICIMRSILKAERASELKVRPETGKPAPNAGRSGWIEQVFSMAITGLKLSEIQRAFDNIVFVNFNYDRCIEHYLLWSLQRIGLPADLAIETVENLNIIRPYGGLGSINPADRSFSDPFKLISRIRTFTESEALHDKGRLSKALSEAEMILFLGFGFHPQNLELLAQSDASPVQRKTVLATVFDVHDGNLRQLVSALGKTLRVDTSGVETYSMGAAEILQKLRMRIVMGVG